MYVCTYDCARVTISHAGRQTARTKRFMNLASAGPAELLSFCRLGNRRRPKLVTQLASRKRSMALSGSSCMTARFQPCIHPPTHPPTSGAVSPSLLRPSDVPREVVGAGCLGASHRGSREEAYYYRPISQTRTPSIQNSSLGAAACMTQQPPSFLPAGHVESLFFPLPSLPVSPCRACMPTRPNVPSSALPMR